MTVLVDASALVALVVREDEADAIGDVLARHADRLCCAVGLWEATRAVARKRSVAMAEAGRAVDLFRTELELRLVPIDAEEHRLAIDAHDRYGKGTGHPARLNMGDCFAYACAKANGAALLYKGDDFVHTDLA